MAGRNGAVSTTRKFVILVAAFLTCASFFGRYPPLGFAMKFCASNLLIGTWLLFWRSVADKFHWPTAIRGLVCGGLFVAPMLVMYALSPSLGNEKGDWAGGVFILGVIAFLGARGNARC